MNALLINPYVTDFKLYDEWMHPVGLYILNSLLLENGWNCQLINCLNRDRNSKLKRHNTGPFDYIELKKPKELSIVERKYRQYGISEDDFANRLKGAKKPDVIFITSAMTYWIDGLINCVKIVQRIFPDTEIIIGGISAILIPEIIRKEIPNVTIFSGLLTGNSDIKISKNLTLTPPKKPISLTKTFSQLVNPIHAPIITTFGCPYRCSYCASTILQKKFFNRPVDLIGEEVSYLYHEKEIREFSFYDDALLFNPQKNFIPFANLISSKNFKLKLHAPNGLHIRWIDRDVLDAMKEVGFTTLRFGYESGKSQYASDTNAKTSKNILIDKVELMLKSGFSAKNIGIYVMGGLPNQTPENMIEDINFISSLGVKAKPVFLSPVPQTPLFNFYSKTHPNIKSNPRIHNDIFFITQIKNWGKSAVDEIRSEVLKLNRLTER